ncbi:MAG TPA: 3-phosphoshikimate 1-carboxyvinyltransferase [Sphingomonadaceae bacterium]|nr:3-phosphoshikimate 1-carboxyvinyltransferase [Sphingomonadaceae bacterium]
MSADTHPHDGDRLRATPSPGLGGDIVVPGDKSISHRALILGGMATGETWIHGLLEGQDVLNTAAAVRAFGADVDRAANGSWRVRGARWASPARPIECGNSGTAARLLMGAAAGFDLEATFAGDESLSGRPMDRVLQPLRDMGATASGENDRLPIALRGGGLRGLSYTNARASAQVKSAILFAGLNAAGPVEVIEPAPSRDHSERMLRAFGCDVATVGGAVRLGAARSLTGTAIVVPGDPSSAAFPLVAALLSPRSQVTVRDVMINPSRTGLLATLAEMGADLRVENRREANGEEIADITARAGPLKGVEVPAARAPSMIDEYPVLAVAAAFAQGRTTMHGIGELRVKESDRLAAVIAGLRACGVEAWAEGDTLIVEGQGGPPPGGGDVAAHGDHRIAMSFFVLGLGARAAVTVDSAGMIATSFPGFVSLMRSIGCSI